MAADNILRTYGDVSAKEDVVLNAVEILTATETQLLTMLPKTSAMNTVHSYLQDTLAAAGSLAVAESADYSTTSLTTPSRKTNIVQIVAKEFRVSRTEQQIAHYHGQNELQRQTQKALLEWGNAAEFDLLRSTLVSGVSGTVPKMEGIIACISSANNYTAYASGTVWDATLLDEHMRLNWENSNGDVASDLFMGSYLRARTDEFVQKTNVVVNNVGVSGIVRTVSTFESAFGTLRIHTHRYIQDSGDATGRVLALRPDKFAVAWLQRPFVDNQLARSGDYDVRAVVGKFTLECINEDSNWFAEGFFIG